MLVAVVDGIDGDVGGKKFELSARFHLQEPTTNKKILWRCTEPETSQEKKHNKFTRYASTSRYWVGTNMKHAHTRAKHKVLISKHRAQITK